MMKGDYLAVSSDGDHAMLLSTQDIIVWNPYQGEHVSG